MSAYDTYTSPLATRNASPEMLRLWSARHKFNTWRRIWLAVAEAQHELTDRGSGASPSTAAPLVTKEQVEELRAVVNRGITDDEIRLAEKYERELRHDVMAHVHALGDSCPKAKGIIHLGMTSQDVVCNADLMTIALSLEYIDLKAHRACVSLAESARRVASLPTLGFTHYQPAQPVTMGRRIAGWASELLYTFRGANQVWISYRGLRGATGTQAAYLALLNDDHEGVDSLELAFITRLQRIQHAHSPRRIDPEPFKEYDYAASNKVWAASMEEASRKSLAAGGMTAEQIDVEMKRQRVDREASKAHSRILASLTYELTGQTYPRVVDAAVLTRLASTASVLHKIATDIRLLCNRKELDEPFEDKQIGSSAMPYKRNPMRCERICGLTRFVINLVGNAYDTAATQWLERTLDDSSNRRLSLPEAFLALDGALDLMHNVASGLVVHEAMVRKNLMAELPFMATENIMMACVKLGGDRQHYHELIRVHAQAAGHRVKHEGLDNDLLERLKNDRNFHSKARGGPLSAELDWDGLLDPMKYIGRSVEQTERFIKEVVEPLREQYKDTLATLGESGPKV